MALFGKPRNLDKKTLKWLEEIVDYIRYRGRPLNREHKRNFLVHGILPKGAEYPEILDQSTWQRPDIQALFFAGKARGIGVASGPYAVATGIENFYARQIRPKTVPGP